MYGRKPNDYDMLKGDIKQKIDSHERWRTPNEEDYLYDKRLIFFLLPRRSGKTTIIQELRRQGDIVVTVNKQMSKYIQGSFSVSEFHKLTESSYDRIWVDEFCYMSKEHQEQILKSEKDTIILSTSAKLYSKEKFMRKYRPYTHTLAVYTLQELQYNEPLNTYLALPRQSYEIEMLGRVWK